MPSRDFSPLITRRSGTPNYSSRNGVQPSLIILHHFAGTDLEGVLNSWATGRKQGSANYVVGNEGQKVGVVAETLSSWTLSSQTWDRKANTFEIENQSTNGWTVSDEAEESTAQLVADICRFYNIYPHRNGDPRHWTVYGHREIYTIFGASYATACPGGLEMDKIVRRAQQILGGGTPTVEKAVEDNTIRPRLVRLSAPGKPNHGLVSYLFPDREVRTKDATEVYRLGRAWGVLKPGQRWEEIVDIINLDEYNIAVDDIRNARSAKRADLIKAVRDSQAP